jgi:hypothetical protein
VEDGDRLPGLLGDHDVRCVKNDHNMQLLSRSRRRPRRLLDRIPYFSRIGKRFFLQNRRREQKEKYGQVRTKNFVRSHKDFIVFLIGLFFSLDIVYNGGV